MDTNDTEMIATKTKALLNIALVLSVVLALFIGNRVLNMGRGYVIDVVCDAVFFGFIYIWALKTNTEKQKNVFWILYTLIFLKPYLRLLAYWLSN